MPMSVSLELCSVTSYVEAPNMKTRTTEFPYRCWSFELVCGVLRRYEFCILDVFCFICASNWLDGIHEYLLFANCIVIWLLFYPNSWSSLAIRNFICILDKGLS